MHESSLARQILELSLAEAARAGGSRVRAVRGRVAETETLSRTSLELASTLYGAATAERIEIVGVAIARPAGSTFGLSPAVAAAVEPAAALAASLAGPR